MSSYYSALSESFLHYLYKEEERLEWWTFKLNSWTEGESGLQLVAK